MRRLEVIWAQKRGRKDIVQTHAHAHVHVHTLSLSLSHSLSLSVSLSLSLSHTHAHTHTHIHSHSHTHSTYRWSAPLVPVWVQVQHLSGSLVFHLMPLMKLLWLVSWAPPRACCVLCRWPHPHLETGVFLLGWLWPTALISSPVCRLLCPWPHPTPTGRWSDLR